MQDVLGNALVNVVSGMGTVFMVLIIIMFIIFAFKLIPVLQSKFQKTATEPAKPAAAPKAAPPVTAGDDVPVAVIMAAISAYEESAGGYGADGFIVRSIKRRF